MKNGGPLLIALASAAGLLAAARSGPRASQKAASAPGPVPEPERPKVPPSKPVMIQEKAPMPQTLARNLGSAMPPDLVISCMAGTVIRGFDVWPEPHPTVIEWAGEKGPGQKHPSWQTAARSKRGQDGRLIPNLIDWFNAGSPERVAIYAFSAGSNSGLRELLRHPEDRAMVSFCGSIDGMHGILNWNRTGYADWEMSVAPFAQYALRAATTDEAMMVVTGNNLAAPTGHSTRTPDMMKDVNRWVAGQVNVHERPPDHELMNEFLGEGEPTPNGKGGIGNAYFFEYPGLHEEDHRLQARIIIPRVTRTFLMHSWDVQKRQTAHGTV